MFLNGMPFYIQMNVIPLRKEDRPSQTQMFEDKQLGKTSVDKDLIQIELLAKICEDQDWRIREQDTHIKELWNRLADYEQELYEKDQMVQLETKLRSSNSMEEVYRDEKIKEGIES